ncbi:hypothetical protein ACNOYE_36755 [Nannocystaceae bacterium ST9]
MRPPTSMTLVLALTLAACKGDEGGATIYDEVPEDDAPSAYAAEYCRLVIETCACEGVPFTSTGQCVDLVRPQIAADLAEAEAAGLEYFPECMAGYLNLLTQDIECKTLGELIDDPALASYSQPTCKVVAGTAVEGEACTNYYTVFGDSCVQGLQCFGTCMALPGSVTTKQVGEVCDPATEICVAGSQCMVDPMAPSDPATCVQLPGEGEACTFGCDVGLYCDPADLICKGPVGEGEACDYQILCQDGLYCGMADLCEPLLAPGEACDGDEQCSEGYVCDEMVDGSTDVCMLEGPLLCP